MEAEVCAWSLGQFEAADLGDRRRSKDWFGWRRR